MSSVAIDLRISGALRDYISLTKPRITFLVLVTAGCGLWLAPGHISLGKALLMLISTALGVSAASTLNCWLERDVDRLMARTRNRPLPAGRLDARSALVFGLALGVVSVGLSFMVNALTGLLGAIALVAYVAIYTPMKLRSPKALVVGAVPGALPPLMGWTAVTGHIDAGALVLFGILFLWQLPHFIAIAIFRKGEYERAGMRVLPAVRGEFVAKLHAAFYAVALIPVSALLVPLHVAGTAYLVTSLVLGVVFAGVALNGFRARVPEMKWARGLFVTSLGYLTLLFAVLVADGG